MKLQKFGIKFFFEESEDYLIKEFIPVFHNWIKKNLVAEHLLIDVADYSHVFDGPGVMLIAHEGHFSLDGEECELGIMYMRRTEIEGDFKTRFIQVFQIALDAAKQLINSKVNKKVVLKNNIFRFITNDRYFAENTSTNQEYFKKEINKILIDRYVNCNIQYENIATKNERLAFTVRLDKKINILN